MMRFIRFLAPLAVLACLALTAEAKEVALDFPLPKTSAPLTIGKEARPIAAWSVLCQRLPEECAVNPREPARIVLDKKTWDLILRTNYRVNTTIRAVTDQEHWGVLDRWDYPNDGRGDCEDMQLLKRRILIEAGLPRRALRMGVVIDELGEGHAVLIARTDRGDLVLDNKTHIVMSWEITGYAMIKMESQSVSGWVTIGPEPAPVATAQP